ncbi:MAG: arylsulfatase [Bacteroidota bacterium]
MTYPRLCFLTCCFGLLCLTSCQSIQPSQSNDQRPNILIVLVDDMGFSDPACFGGEIQTPHLDRLAQNGLRFTQFYNAGRCCPTRASLLTGLYPHQAGIGQMTRDQGEEFPGYRGRLMENTLTIAEALGAAGYQTAMVGKWHASLTPVKGGKGDSEEHMRWLNHQGYAEDDFGDVSTYPTARGFDKYFGNIWGVVNYFDPFSLVNGTEPVKEVPDDFYLTDAISDTAVSYIDAFAQSEKPFFLYVAHCAPHWPLHALPEDIAKYKDTYREGWDAIREQRFARQQQMGLWGSSRIQLSQAANRSHQWEDEPNQAWEAGAMAVHAAMIDRVDQGLGRILHKLETLGELDNTLIMFLSDNGASPERYGKPGFDRNSETRDGQQVHYVDPELMAGPETSYMYIGQTWANVANTPFRYWKARTFEGGVCTPFVAHWPAGISEPAGSIKDQPAHIIDLMATCLDVSGTQYPQRFEGRTITPLEGQSLRPLFEGEAKETDRQLLFEHFHAKAFRWGDWKLVAYPHHPWELYNLKEDRTELNNLADQMPEKVEEMAALWQQKAEDTFVFPQWNNRKPDKLPEQAY